MISFLYKHWNSKDFIFLVLFICIQMNVQTCLVICWKFWLWQNWMTNSALLFTFWASLDIWHPQSCHWFCYKIRHILQLWFPTELSKLSSSCGFSVKITDPRFMSTELSKLSSSCGFSVKITDPRFMSLFATQPRPFPSIFFTLLFGSVPTLK